MFTKNLIYERANKGRRTGDANTMEDGKRFCEGYNQPYAKSEASI